MPYVNGIFERSSTGGGVASIEELTGTASGTKSSSTASTAATTSSSTGTQASQYQEDRTAMQQAATTAQQKQAQQEQYLSTLQSQQQTQAQQAAGYTAQAGASATAQGVLGQDVYSQKLAAMSTGQFDSSDPSYAWRFQQGQQAVERSGAAQGLLGSGNVAIALQNYGQQSASTEYAAQFSRMLQGSQNATAQYAQAYSSLASLMGQQTAIGSLGSSLAQTGVAQGQLDVQQQGVLGNITQLGINQGNLQHSYYATDVGATTARLGISSSAQSSQAQTGLGYARLSQEAQQSAAEQQGMSDLYNAYKTGGVFSGTSTASTPATSTSAWGTSSQPQATFGFGDSSWEEE